MNDDVLKKLVGFAFEPRALCKQWKVRKVYDDCNPHQHPEMTQSIVVQGKYFNLLSFMFTVSP